MKLIISLCFDPTVWGTVSDWFTFIITAITAYYLYHTLKSQKEVQNTQNQLFEIENIRFKESVKPNLKYNESSKSYKIKDETFATTIEISNDANSEAIDIEIDYKDQPNICRIIIPINYIAHPTKNLKKGDFPYLLHFYIIEKPEKDEFISFDVNYKDISGVKYKQRVFCIVGETLRINNGIPNIVNT
jgi:hypothetical protein